MQQCTVQCFACSCKLISWFTRSLLHHLIWHKYSYIICHFCNNFCRLVFVALSLSIWLKSACGAPLPCPVGCSCQTSHYLLCDGANLDGFRLDPKTRLKAHTVSFRNSIHLDQSVLRCEALVDVHKLDITGTGYNCAEVRTTLRTCISRMESFRCDRSEEPQIRPNTTTVTTTTSTTVPAKPDPTVHRKKKILVPKNLPKPTTTTTTITASPPGAHGADVAEEGNTTTVLNETITPPAMVRWLLVAPPTQ